MIGLASKCATTTEARPLSAVRARTQNRADIQPEPNKGRNRYRYKYITVFMKYRADI